MDNKETKFYKDACVSIFKRGFDLYKELNKDFKTDLYKLSNQQSPDYILFTKIIKGFKILSDILLFTIMSHKVYFDSICEELDIYKMDENKKEKYINELEFNIPKSFDETIYLYSKYPDTIEIIKEELCDIQSIENFEGLLLLQQINPLLYYTVAELDNMSEKILYFEDDINKFYYILSNIIKKTMNLYIELLKT